MNTWIVPIIVAFAAPIITYLVAARKLSGRINTSEASTLWQEATTMREEYRTRAINCEARLEEVLRENFTLKQELRNALD